MATSGNPVVGVTVEQFGRSKIVMKLGVEESSVNPDLFGNAKIIMDEEESIELIASLINALCVIRRERGQQDDY